MSGNKVDEMERLSTSQDDNEMVLAEAVAWAEANIPLGLLPDWVFSGLIALKQSQGLTVHRGEC